MTDESGLREAYLALIQDAILGRFAPGEWLDPVPRRPNPIDRLVRRLLATKGLELAKRHREDRDHIEAGRVWPRHGMTMVGRARLDNIRFCVENVLTDGVPGNLIEAGVWQGGASIFTRAILKAWNVTDRTVWLADSFEGLPPPDPENYPADGSAYPWHEHNEVLGVALDEVKNNFAKMHLLDDQVRFLKGFFKDTLSTLADENWSVIRLDGDLYESTIQSLEALYPNLSPGGWVIVDDYFWIEECRAAVNDYRDEHGIADAIRPIDFTGAFWQRSG